MKGARITALAGGTGSVKLVRGLYTINRSTLTVIVNVGDNVWMHGLYVCPDIDTIVYGLAGILDQPRGWGVKDDTFNFQKQLASLGEETWFQLGDRDLATHVWRTMRLRKGATVSEITKALCERFSIEAKVIPVTNEFVETRVVADHEEMHLQEFWVKRRGRDTVTRIKYFRAAKAQPAPEVLDAIGSADLVIICPANPISSIGPILAVPGVRRALSRTSAKVLAVSPIIGSNPVSGPAGTFMKAMKIEVSPLGVALFYRSFLDEMVLHISDRNLAPRMTGIGVKPKITDVLMRSAEDEIRLAKFLVTDV